MKRFFRYATPFLLVIVGLLIWWNLKEPKKIQKPTIASAGTKPHFTPPNPFSALPDATNIPGLPDFSAQGELVPSNLTNRIVDLESELGRLRRDIANLQDEKELAEKAPLDFTTPTYKSVRTTVGVLFVSTVNAEKYLDGYRVRILIGNPLFVTLQ